MDTSTTVAVDIMVRTTLGSSQADFSKILAAMEADAKSWASRMSKIMSGAMNPATQSKNAATDTAMKRAQADIQNMGNQRVKWARDTEESINKIVTQGAEKQYQARLAAYQRFVKQFQNQASGSGGGGGNLGNAAGAIGGLPGGSLISAFLTGGAAGLGFAAIEGGIDIIKSLTTELYNLGKASVESAATFQATTNSFILFTGSVQGAHDAIASIDALARNTPGLSFEEAEQGAKRLRAMGFEAQTTENILVGLAKQKLIFGGFGEQDEQNTLRVLRHLDQLQAGAANTRQIITQMVRDMPGLSVVITDTFGTADAFVKALKQDTQGALDKFAQGMANAQAPAGGFNAAMTNLHNTFTQLERDFGTPLLDPLTQDVRLLSDFLLSNESTFRQWGQEVGDIIRGATAAFTGLGDVIGAIAFPLVGQPGPQARNNQSLSLPGLASLGIGGALALPTAGLSTLIPGLDILGQVNRHAANAEDLKNPDSPQNPLNIIKGINAAIFRDAERVAARGKEQALANQVQIESASRTRDVTVSQQNFALQEVAAGIPHRYTIEQEIAYDKKIHDIRAKAIQEESVLQQKGFDQERTAAEGDKGKLALINIKADQQFLKSQADARKNDLEAQKQYADKMVALEDRRRQETLQSLQIQQQAEQQVFSAQQFAINRRIEFTNQGFDDLIALEQNYATQQEQGLKSQLNTQLTDLKLSNEQRKNLQKDTAVKIAGIEENLSQNILKIGDERRAKELAHLNAMFQQAGNVLGSQGGIVSGLNQLVTPGARFGQGVGGQLGNIGGTFPAQLFPSILQAQAGNAPAFQAQSLVFNEQQRIQSLLTQNEVIRATEEDLKARSGGTQTERDTAASNLTVANLKKAQLYVDQQTAKMLFEQANDLEKINEFTKEITAGTVDANILDQQKVELAKAYQTVMLASRTQEITLADKGLVQLERQTEAQKVLTELRGRDLQALFDIDKANILIADQTVFHADQANAKVLQFLASQKGVTDAMADFRTGLIQAGYDYIDKGLDKVLHKFGLLGDAVRQLIDDLAKLVLNQAFKILFGGQSASGGGSKGGGIFQTIFGGLGQGGGTTTGGGLITGSGIGPGGTPTFNPTGGSPIQLPSQIARAFGISPTSNIPATGGGLLNIPDGQHDPLGGNPQHGGATGGGRAGGIGSFLNSSTFAGALTGGLLGTSLGGSSTTGKILGGLGGAAIGAVAGEVVPTILAGTFAGLTALGFATLGIGAGLAVLAFILSRKAREKKEKAQVTQLSGAAVQQMNQLIADVKAFKIDGASAYAQGTQIRDQFAQQIAGLKSGGAKTLAQQQLASINALLATLQQEGDRADRAHTIAKATDESLVPTFATGGFTGFGAGAYPMIAHGAEAVLTQSNIMALGGYRALQSAGVRGISLSGAPDRYETRSGGGGGGSDSRPIYVIPVYSEEDADKMMDIVSPLGFAKKVKVTHKDNLAGVNDMVAQKLIGN